MASWTFKAPPRNSVTWFGGTKNITPTAQAVASQVNSPTSTPAVGTVTPQGDISSATPATVINAGGADNSVPASVSGTSTATQANKITLNYPLIIALCIGAFIAWKVWRK